MKRLQGVGECSFSSTGIWRLIIVTCKFCKRIIKEKLFRWNHSIIWGQRVRLNAWKMTTVNILSGYYGICTKVTRFIWRNQSSVTALIFVRTFFQFFFKSFGGNFLSLFYSSLKCPSNETGLPGPGFKPATFSCCNHWCCQFVAATAWNGGAV